MRDLRYALRTLRKQPIFTLVAALTLALGIGANTAIFSVVYQVLLRPLPYAQADRLFFIWNSYPTGGLPQASVSIPDYLDRKAGATSMEDATLFTMRTVSLAQGEHPEQLRALLVTPSFFSTVGVVPAFGRPFTEAEAMTGADRFAILTNDLWVSRFGSDRSIVGGTVRLNGEAYRVVGVMPPSFTSPAQNIALLLPFSFTPQQQSDQGRGNEFSQMIARLRPGATIEQVNGEMKAIVMRNMERLPERREFMRISSFTGYAIGIRDQLAGDVRTPLLVLQIGVVFVLLIACANVANLLLMRATGRARELAIRTTLGAGRWQLVRQMLTEGIVLSTIGGAGGLVLGLAGVRFLLAMASQQIPGLTDASLHPAVLALTIVLSLVTGLLFGSAPAVAAIRGNTSTLLKDDIARGSSGRGAGMTRAGLVVAETAIALMLLTGAGLLIKSFARLRQVNPGFTADHVLTAQISLPPARYADAASRRAFWTRLLEKVRMVPGVAAAGLTSNVPFNGMVGSGSYNIVGYTPSANEAPPHGRQEIVGGDYFRALQIPLVEGRVFDESDGPDRPPVVVVDEYLVKRYFAGRSAVGQQINRGGRGSTAFTIIGVVGTINAIDLGQPVTKERIYYPATQQPFGSLGLVLKTSIDPLSLVPAVRAASESIDPEQPIADVRTMEEWMGRSLENRRMPTLLLTLFGAVALGLSAIGIYGVLAFGVAQRTRELGIRRALGADSSTILSLIIGQGLRRAAVGIVIGLAGSFALTRYLQSLLFGIGAFDPPVFASVTLLLFGVATAACYVPARRATRLDPTVALRDA